MEFRRIEKSDSAGIIEVLNYYINNTFNAYPESEVSTEMFDNLWEVIKDYPNVCCVDEGHIVGYATLRPFRGEMPCFARAAEITYFILPDYTGQKLGEKMLDIIIEQAKNTKIKVLLAHISSLNKGSVRFHEKHGFEKCGHFKRVIEKKGAIFDMIWMQKEI